MSVGRLSKIVRFESDNQTQESPDRELTVGPQPRISNSLWNLPGLDKDTFYAAALYLHAAAGELPGKPWIRGPTTPEITRNFLDCLADCFARSKLSDARDHVSATTMVRNENQRKITLYIAKNDSNKGYAIHVSGEQLDKIRNENKTFAVTLVDWFGQLANRDPARDDPHDHSNIFQTMCDFSQSRLEHYIIKISECDVDSLDLVLLLNSDTKLQNGWTIAKGVINKCKLYANINPGGQGERSLTEYSRMAGEARKTGDFHYLRDKIDTALSDSKVKRLADAVKWISYLGRIFSAWNTFSDFCKHKEQRGYAFNYVLLPSQEDDWNGNSYMAKALSWTGNLDLHSQSSSRKAGGFKNIESLMTEIANSGSKARVHCEMQLMAYFSQETAGTPVDYFGCSKKSCWLCWQMMLHNQKYSMKDSHRKIFPRWAFPFDFSPSKPALSEGLRSAYADMLILVQDKVIRQSSLSSSESFPQSSFRPTPHYRLAMPSIQPGDKLDVGPFSGNPIMVKERFQAAMVPALHLPTHGSREDFRHVIIYAYEKTELEYGMSGIEFQGKELLLAIELLTRPASMDSLEVEECQKCFWEVLAYPDLIQPEIEYRMYYRSDSTTLAPNLSIMSIWRTLYGEEYQDFPWRGDIFIRQVERDTSKNLLEQDDLTESSQIDPSACLRALRRSFEHLGAKFSTYTQKVNLQHARTRVEQHAKMLLYATPSY